MDNRNFIQYLIAFLLLLLGGGLGTVALADDLIISRAMLEDRHGDLEIAEVSDRQFSPIKSALTEGYSESAYWLRLQVRAPSTGSEVVLQIGPALLDEVRLYEPQEGDAEAWTTRVTGDRHPYEDRDRREAGLGFVVNVTSPEKILYLRIKTTSPYQVTVQGLEPQEASRAEIRTTVLRNIFIGLMLWAMIWAIDHYIVGREPAVGLFALYQGLYILYGLSATGNLAHLVPYHLPQLTDWLSNILTCAVPFAFLLFSRALLRPYAPPWMGGFSVLLAALPIQLAAMAMGYTLAALSSSTIVFMAGAWYCAALALAATQEQVPSRKALRTSYIVLAALALFLGLKDLGWLASIGLIGKSEWALLFAGVLNSGLICTLLYQRLRQSQRDALKAAVTLALSQQALEIERQHKTQAQAHARTDYLTGLFNRRHFAERVEQELVRALDKQEPLSLLMIDIDHFKQVNDTWGHRGGDAVLQKVAQLIRDTLRKQDILGRIGGEEFAVALIGTDQNDALALAQRIRTTVEAFAITLPNKQSVKVTLSLGLTQLGTENTSLDDLLHKADEALYRAKNAGRNVVMAT